MTTDKWTSEIYLSFGIKLAECKLKNLSENWSQFVTNYIHKRLFSLFLDIVWFHFSYWLVLRLFVRIFFTYAKFNNNRLPQVLIPIKTFVQNQSKLTMRAFAIHQLWIWIKTVCAFSMDIDPNMYTHVYFRYTPLLQSQGPDWIGPGMQTIQGGRLCKLLFVIFTTHDAEQKAILAAVLMYEETGRQKPPAVTYIHVHPHRLGSWLV